MKRYYDVLIVTETSTEADDINALGNDTIFAIPFGSSSYHSRRYKRIVNAYVRKGTEAEALYAKMVTLGLRSSNGS